MPDMTDVTEECPTCWLRYETDPRLQASFLVEELPAITAGRRTIYAGNRVVHQCPDGTYGSGDLIA